MSIEPECKGGGDWHHIEYAAIGTIVICPRNPGNLFLWIPETQTAIARW
jgi:hypothetical protein